MVSLQGYTGIEGKLWWQKSLQEQNSNEWLTTIRAKLLNKKRRKKKRK
jgi:hypothetical protein